MVIARTQVDRREAAMVKLRGQSRIATHQRGGAVGVALSLEQLVFVDRAKLANGAIDRANEIGPRQWACAFFQSPGKKFIKTGVAGDIGVRRLHHVDVVLANKPADQRCGARTSSSASHHAAKHGKCPFGQEVLG